MSPRDHWRVWFGIIIGGVLLWLTFRGVDWPSLGRAFLSASWIPCGIAVLFFLANLVVRALRWQTLMMPVRRLTFLDMFAYSQIGFLANNLLPLRAGELLRAVLLGQRHAISKSAVLATIAVERVSDVLCLLLFASALAPVMEMPQMVKQSILLIGGVTVSAIVVLWVLSSREVLVERLMRKVLILVPSPLRERVADFVILFTQGLQALQSGGRVLLLLLLSLMAWLFVLFEFLFIFVGFDVTLPWYAGVFVLVVVNVGIAIPSSPAFIGVYHFLVVTALSVFTVNKAQALSIALVTHGLAFVINNVLGFTFLFRENVAFSQLRRGKEISGGEGLVEAE